MLLATGDWLLAVGEWLLASCFKLLARKNFTNELTAVIQRFTIGIFLLSKQLQY